MARRTFDIPVYFRSPVISVVKEARTITDPRRRDFTPSLLDFGPVQFRIARHFGFCYGVENAIEIAYATVEQNPGKRIFLLSEMIHNPLVNEDLQKRGVQFIMKTSGEQIVGWDKLGSDDIVIVPAFGTTLEIQQRLSERGIDAYKYDTTCPFVEKVWNRSSAIGEKGYTIVVHGKKNHEETRATFSHSSSSAPTVVVQNMAETETLAAFITGAEPIERFSQVFGKQVSEGFNPVQHLQSIGVVNQTTMLAAETQAIADRLKVAMVERYGEEEIEAHFADTRDTLCYATNENQSATYALIESGADIAVVVGGYNSSNTSHIVELCEEHMPTFFVKGPEEILSQDAIRHFNLHSGKVEEVEGWLPVKSSPVSIILTSGASCPDAVVDEVLQKIIAFFPSAASVDDALAPFRHPATEA